MASSTASQGARYFGQTSPKELKELERNAARATTQQLAKAAAVLQQTFSGQYFAWFGGWALKLRGSLRDTTDLDLCVLADDVGQVRDRLAVCSWAIMAYYATPGSIQERLFMDIGEDGQVVGVDIVISGKLNTPSLDQEGTFELIQPSFKTPQGDKVPVIDLTWQVEGKLAAWTSRKKDSDYRDLRFLFGQYGSVIKHWSQHLDVGQRQEFYIVYKADVRYKAARKEMKETLGLDGNGGSP